MERGSPKLAIQRAHANDHRHQTTQQKMLKHDKGSKMFGDDTEWKWLKMARYCVAY
jgi:hypothetical protein